MWYLANIHQSNWSVEHIRVARHSKLICALVLALRRVPIFAPGGGAAALGDPTNPSYSVAVSDEVASAARNKAAKDADAARLSPMNAGRSQQDSVTKDAKDDETPKDGPSPTSENMTSDPMNTIQLSNTSQTALQMGDDVNEEQNSKTVASRSETSPQASNIQSNMSFRLQKSRSAQGRRRAGSSAPLHVTTTSRQDPQTIDSVSSFGEA